MIGMITVSKAPCLATNAMCREGVHRHFVTGLVFAEQDSMGRSLDNLVPSSCPHLFVLKSCARSLTELHRRPHATSTETRIVLPQGPFARFTSKLLSLHGLATLSDPGCLFQ